MTTDNPRTVFAMAAVGLAEKLAFFFAGEIIETPRGRYHVAMTAPEGMSTGGGAQALQHITLAPDQGSAIVIGTATQKDQVAELRTHRYLVDQHEKRHSREAFPIPRAQYEAIAAKLKTFLTEQGLKVTEVNPPPAIAPVVPEKSGGVSPVVVVLLLCAVVVLGVLVVLLMPR